MKYAKSSNSILCCRRYIAKDEWKSLGTVSGTESGETLKQS